MWGGAWHSMVWLTGAGWHGRTFSALTAVWSSTTFCAAIIIIITMCLCNVCTLFVRKFVAFACWLLGWEGFLWEIPRIFYVQRTPMSASLVFFSRPFAMGRMQRTANTVLSSCLPLHLSFFGFLSMIYDATHRLFVQFTVESLNYYIR